MEDATDSLTHLSVRDLLDRLASRDPVPGGGSAAALAGAMAAALVAMVAELTVGRPDATEHQAAIGELRDAATIRREALLELAGEDAAAYAAVVQARRLPKETDAERDERARRLQHAMLAAAEVPLRIARVAAEVLDLANQIAPIGNRNAVSDAGVAAQLASAAVRGAALNVRINLPYLPEHEPLRATAGDEVGRLEAAAASLEAEALHEVAGRMQPS
ncbi:MAG: cyclodeaminase/cyclohydrolase family protein [Candidatus Limnocylindria bacterium]